ncbi:MAG: S-adenosyl-L-homocysteine hydrolase [Croceibacterium sp.]
MKLGAWVIGACLAAGAAVSAMAQDVETAASLRRLDMMLMVTSLRCRFGEDDFRVEYDRFRASNLPVLRDAALMVTGEFTRQYGKQGAIREFDRMNVAMANYYGAGHPRLDCHELKQAAGQLVAPQGEAGLVAAAARLLDSGDNAGTQLARR